MNEQNPHHDEFLSFANGLADIARTMIQSAAFGDHSIEIKKDHSLKMSIKWKPYRSVATWYFWRSLDPIPVEY